MKSKKKLKRAKITRKANKERKIDNWSLGEFAIFMFLNVVLLYSLLFLATGKAPFGF